MQVQVSDTGRGIPADELPFVFDRHYRGAESRQSDAAGAGLGLAIAKRVVELHGGQLRVESLTGKGTCFMFDLPAKRERRRQDDARGHRVAIASLNCSSALLMPTPPAAARPGCRCLN